MNDTVNKTRKLGLCLSCEVCAAVCPVEAISMEFAEGQFLPVVDRTRCENCGLCARLCPGLKLELSMDYSDNISHTDLNGTFVDCYSGHCIDGEIRSNATSGGFVSTLLAASIQSGEYEGAFVLPFSSFTQTPARLVNVKSREEILSAAKSKYLPASVFNVVKSILSGDFGRTIIVGTACQIFAIKSVIAHTGFDASKAFFIGLFCDRTLNFNLIRYFEEIYSRSDERIEKFDYRCKDISGWPGDVRIAFDSGRTVHIDRRERMKLKPFFQLKRCLFCADKLNIDADISVGDCYIPGRTDISGKSSIIVRTQLGQDVLKQHKALFELERSEIEEIDRAQKISEKQGSIAFARAFSKKHGLDGLSGVSRSVLRELENNLDLAQLGASFDIKKIERCLDKRQNDGWRKIKTGIRYGLLLAKAWTVGLTAETSLKFDKRPYLGIVGGGFGNKGAQAMTLTVVDNLKRLFPDKQIVLFSSHEYTDEVKNQYAFRILHLSLKMVERYFCGNIFKPDRFVSFEKEVALAFSGCAAIFDISGFALTSQFLPDASLFYLLRIILAKKYGVPFYILPQSFGPFDYPGKYGLFLRSLARIALKYPDKVFSREKSSAKFLSNFAGVESEISPDIVLRNSDYELSNIYNSGINPRKFNIEIGSVGVIPNLRVFERVDGEALLNAYQKAIETLLKNGKRVYVLCHSAEDIGISRIIKAKFSSDDRIVVIEDDLAAIELESIISQFDFVIASRYHSIVHAFKHGVPAVVAGWADKYVELAGLFNQQNYLIDCRERTNFDKIEEKTREMLDNLNREHEIIKSKAMSIRENTIFSTIAELLKRNNSYH